MSYSVEYDPQAVIDLEQLPKTMQKRVISKIQWLADNFAQIQPLPLSANLAGFYKLRVGDYRIIYEVDSVIRVITVDRIGHRRDIYES